MELFKEMEIAELENRLEFEEKKCSPTIILI